MNGHIKAWLAALRSGEYKQTTFGLKDTDGSYCCLGVACDVYNPENWQGTSYVVEEHRSNGFLLDPVRQAFGISMGFEGNLVSKNDSHGYTFEQIADFIEASIADGTAFK